MENSTTDVKTNKERARKTAKSRLSFLTWAYKREASEFITMKVKRLEEYDSAACVMLYLSMENEPDTESLISDCFKNGKRVLVPRCLSDGIMEAVEIFSSEDLVPGKYGIREPKASLIAVDPEKIDFCIVPCLAAGPDPSRRYRRLGHGMGYYDRFLPTINCKTCVLCFKELVREEIPVDELDCMIDMMVTE